MLRMLAATAAMIVLAGYAHAGCADYTTESIMLSPAPRVNLCIGGACEVANLEVICATSDSTYWQYSNGLRVGDSAEGEMVAAIGEAQVPVASITCEPLDDDLDSCGFD